LLVNTFVLVAAAIFHQMLIPATEPVSTWQTTVIRAICWLVFPLLYFLFVFHVLRFHVVIGALYAFVALFVVWAVITGLRWLRSQPNAKHESIDPTPGRKQQ